MGWGLREERRSCQLEKSQRNFLCKPQPREQSAPPTEEEEPISVGHEQHHQGQAMKYIASDGRSWGREGMGNAMLQPNRAVRFAWVWDSRQPRFWSREVRTNTPAQHVELAKASISEDALVKGWLEAFCFFPQDPSCPKHPDLRLCPFLGKCSSADDQLWCF